MEQFVVGFYAPAEPLPREIELQVTVDDGQVTVRLYAPESDGHPLPCHIYFHGGGFWLGRLDHFDALCRTIARDAGCAVAAVDYRLAPEHKFPAAPEDSYAALLWVSENADALGIDRARISVGGVSAGGNLATVVSMMARDRGGPDIVLQVLEVPVLDLSTDEPLRIDGLELPPGKNTYRRHYLDDPSQALLPYVSPLLAPSVAKLPPALIMCAEYDPLAAEGEAYAKRLRADDVPVEHYCWPSQFHGAQPMAKLIPQVAASYQSILAIALRRAFHMQTT
jgi:acetyl esterase